MAWTGQAKTKVAENRRDQKHKHCFENMRSLETMILNNEF